MMMEANETTLPTREQAAEIIRPHVLRGPYRCVSLEDAGHILGGDVFARLEKDPIRRLGPTRDTVYEWNVIDYLTSSGLRGAKS